MTPTRPSSVLYDARTVRPGMTGVGRYTLSLLGAMAALPDAPPLRALINPSALDAARRDPALAPVELIAAPVSHESHPAGDWWLRTGLPRLLQPGELYHGPAFIIPGGRQPFARVVTVHDLFVFTHPQFFSFKFRTWLRWATRRACRFADRIIVPTQVVCDQIKERELAPGRKIHVIPEAPDTTAALWEMTPESPIFNSNLVPADGRPTIITIGTLDPRKDPATARAGFVELIQRLNNHAALPSPIPPNLPVWLWIGGPGTTPDGTPEPLRREAEQLGFRCLGHQPGAATRPALAAATVYVTCSHSEGFGIPLVEAMAAGCPIIASDIPVHHEVAGPAALYFPPSDPSALAQALERLLTHESLRNDLIEHGRRRSARFSWQHAARQTLQIYHEACRP